MYGGEERCIQGLVGRPEGNRILGKPRHRWCFSRTTLLHAVTLYQQQALRITIQNKVISAARLQVTEGPVALY